MSFENRYIKIRELIQSELIEIEKKTIETVNIKEPLNTHLKKFLLAPSKRIRPLLAILYLKAQGYEINNKQFELLSAIELVHNASLIHDDIIDDSNLRRGIKTISANFGNKLGVISGDYLLAIAMEKISEIDNINVLKKFSNTLKQMCIGEINQNFDRFKIGTIENYIEKSKNKTAYLFETAVTCSQMLQLKNSITENEFALNFGIAFQIRDDLQNILKIDNSKPSTDIKEGIYNAPIIYSNSIENYDEGIEKTKVLLNNYIEKAKKNIENFEKNKYTLALFELLESLKNE